MGFNSGFKGLIWGLDEGDLPASRPRCCTPEIGFQILTESKAGWAPQPTGTFGLETNLLLLPGNQ